MANTSALKKGAPPPRETNRKGSDRNLASEFERKPPAERLAPLEAMIDLLVAVTATVQVRSISQPVGSVRVFRSKAVCSNASGLWKGNESGRARWSRGRK